MTRSLRALSALRALAASAIAVAALALSVGATPAAAENPDPLREKHGAWDIRCPKPDACYMAQELIGPKGQPQMAMLVRKLPNPTTDSPPLVAQVEIIVPLGMFIFNGVAMNVDQIQLGAMPIERCLSYGCVSRPMMRADAIDQLKNGGEVIFNMWPDPQRPPLVFKLSLSGFTAAYGAL